jgi:SAM-dependent methyltransferase
MSCEHVFAECEYVDYLQCIECGTLKSTAPGDPSVLYTQTYWSGHRSLPEAQIFNIDTYLERGVTKSNYILSQIRCSRRAAALEIGCFPGILLKRLVEYGFGTVLGVDPIRIPTHILQSHGIIATIVEGYFPGVELAASAYDLVVGSDVFEHTDDPQRFLRECFRVCAPNGQLLLVTPLVQWDRTFNTRMICPAEHVYIHSADDAAALCSDAGFIDVEFSQWAFGHDVISARKPRSC